MTSMSRLIGRHKRKGHSRSAFPLFDDSPFNVMFNMAPQKKSLACKALSDEMIYKELVTQVRSILEEQASLMRQDPASSKA